MAEKYCSKPRMKTTRKSPYLIPFLFSLAMSSKVFFDYNKIATSSEIGMDCRVSDPEEISSIKIHQGNIEKVTMTTGCIMKSNDSRLSISCRETEDSILLSINMTGYASSDLGTWNCSDGKSYDTVAFEYFIRELQDSETTFNCIVHEECNLLLPLRKIPFRYICDFSPVSYLRTIDGRQLLRFVHCELRQILDNDWRRRIIINDNTTNPLLNFTLLDVDISDAGIYYLIGDMHWMESAVFIIKTTDYPKQPAIVLRNHEAESKLGPYELYCASESKSQPTFTRKQLSFTWRLNGHNLTELQPCFRLSGPVLTLCMDACGLAANGNISVTCTAEEDGLESNESQPFIVPVSRVISAASAIDLANQDQQVAPTIGTLVGVCLGSFSIGVLFAVLSMLFITKRGPFCSKEQKEKERNTDVPNDTLYVNSIMADTHNATVGEVRQYEALDHTTIEHRSNQYDVVQSKGSEQKGKEDTYEVV